MDELVDDVFDKIVAMLAPPVPECPADLEQLRALRLVSHRFAAMLKMPPFTVHGVKGTPADLLEQLRVQKYYSAVVAAGGFDVRVRATALYTGTNILLSSGIPVYDAVSCEESGVIALFRGVLDRTPFYKIYYTPATRTLEMSNLVEEDNVLYSTGGVRVEISAGAIHISNVGVDGVVSPIGMVRKIRATAGERAVFGEYATYVMIIRNICMWSASFDAIKYVSDRTGYIVRAHISVPNIKK